MNARAEEEIKPEQPGPPWKRIAVLAVGGVTIAACAVVTTLAATHQSAVRENFTAYTNGFLDGVTASNRGFVEDDWFDW